MRPDVAPEGTLAAMAVAVAEVAVDRVTLKTTRLFAGVGLKFVPLIVTAVPGVPMVGVKPVIIGPPQAPTEKGLVLVADPVGVVTLIGPVVAPAGTDVTICVGVAETTEAGAPLKVTVIWLAVALNPVPRMVTEVPIGPHFGVNSM